VAEVSITPASVVPGSDAEFYRGLAGATITAGMAVYLDEMTNTLKLADANLSLESADVKGIALHAASANQPLKIQTAGEITIGGTVVLATVYILGAGGSGGIAPAADKASGWYTSVIGVASSASKLRINIFNSRALTA
jgi:hypothetical protein